MKNLGEYVFFGCSNLTSIEIPNSMTLIDGWVFCECSNLTSVKIGNGITSIIDSAFFRCTNLKYVEFVGDMPIVNDVVFSYAEGTVIGYYPLNNPTWLDVITSSKFGGKEFVWKTTCATEHKPATAIKEKEIVATCTSGGSYEEVINCLYCDIEISRTLKSISQKEHSWDNGTITRTATTTTLGEMTYKCVNCGEIKKADIPKLNNDTNNSPNNSTVSSEYKVTTNGTGNKRGTVAYTGVSSQKRQVVTIPATVVIDGITYDVTSIAANAFKNNQMITKVVIASSVTKIGNNAFSGCKKLKSVTLSNKLTAIGDKAFYKCIAFNYGSRSFTLFAAIFLRSSSKAA